MKQILKNKGTVKLIVQTFSAEKIKVEGSVMTFQNIFFSMADFRDVVSVLPCSPTNKGKKNLCGWTESTMSLLGFLIVIVCRARNVKTAAAFANWLAPKKGALFSLISFFASFCVYYIPFNYVIPQAMPWPHAIPQTHSIFYPHRFAGFLIFFLFSNSNSYLSL